jgi:hypothetical protein
MAEIIHQWHTLAYPEMALVKVVGVACILFLTGFLPWIDNYAHIFGFLFGLQMSYALLPFVSMSGGNNGSNVNTSNEYERKRKIVVIWVCFVSVATLFIGLILLFYLSPFEDCEICKLLNCIPITKDFCADQNIDPSHYNTMMVD